MELIKIDVITIEYSTADQIRYSCYIKEHDIYFSSKIEKGTEYIIHKAKTMIKMMERFIAENPEFK